MGMAFLEAWLRGIHRQIQFIQKMWNTGILLAGFAQIWPIKSSYTVIQEFGASMQRCFYHSNVHDLWTEGPNPYLIILNFRKITQKIKLQIKITEQS